jgi:hypothetical protein
MHRNESVPLRDRAMGYLVEWVESLTRFAEAVHASGGPPQKLSKRWPTGVFSAVITVTDAVDR